jgi:hypothetical protein
MKPARTETYEHTISGLLGKRADLFNEAAIIRDGLRPLRTILMRLIGCLERLAIQAI